MCCQHGSAVAAAVHNPARVTASLRIQKTWDGTPIPAAEQAEIVLTPLAGGGLQVEVEAPYHGDPAPPTRPGPTDRLWDHEVVELFLAGPAERGRHLYTEIELGPHCHHLVLRFLAARTPVDRALPVEFVARIEGHRWHGAAILPAAYLPPRPWSANAFAMHGGGSRRRHLAAAPLPGPRPDFHQPDRFPPIPI